MRERKRDYTRGLVDSVMPMGYQLMQVVTPFVQAMPCRPPFGQTIPQGAEAIHQGKDDQEQDGKPDAVRS